MTDQPDDSQQARDDALVAVGAALSRLCSMCRIRVLSNVLACEAIGATWPETPVPLLNEASMLIGQCAAAHFQIRTAQERESCAGSA